MYVGGLIRPSVVLDGRVIGTWMLDRASGRITVETFAPLPRRVLRLVEAEVADVGRFLAVELKLTLA